MARRKRSVAHKGSVDHLAHRTNTNPAAASSLPTSHTFQTRFKRIFNNKQEQHQEQPLSRRHSSKKYTADDLDDELRPTSPASNHYHHHFHHHHFSRSNSDASSASSFSNRPHSRFLDLPPQPTEVASGSAAAAAASAAAAQRYHNHYNQHARLPAQHTHLPARNETALARYPASAPARSPSRRYHHQPSGTPSGPQLARNTSSKHNQSHHHRQRSQLSRQPSTSSLFHQQMMPHRYNSIHSNIAARMASLESMASTGSFVPPPAAVRLKRSASIASVHGLAPIKNFFLRLFKRRTAGVITTTSSRKRRRPFRRALALKLPPQYKIFRQKRQQTSMRGQISQPLSVTRHSGMDKTGQGEVLSIKSRYSIKVPRKSSQRKRQSMGGTHEVQLQDRLNRLQAELDEAKHMQRNESKRSSSARNDSILSMDSSLMDDALMRRMSLSSANHQFRPAANASVMRKVSATDFESGVKIEDALALVDYLRQAIAERIVLRQRIRTLEKQEHAEWQRLNSVEEEESITGKTETVSSFSSIPPSPAVRIVENFKPVHARGYSQATTMTTRKVSSASSYYSARDNHENGYGYGTWQGDVFYDANGDSVTVTPIQSRRNSQSKHQEKSHKRTASSIRRALRPERMADKYNALLVLGGGASNTRKELPPLPIEEEPSPKEDAVPALPQQNDNAWVRSNSPALSSSTASSRPRPLPPTPERKTASKESMSSKNSNLGKQSVTRTGVSGLLQQQRKMSDKILADMVQEMEELQARSMLLSDMAKSQKSPTTESIPSNENGSLFLPSSDEETTTDLGFKSGTYSTSSSSSDLSPARELRKQLSLNTDKKSNHYLLENNSAQTPNGNTRAVSHGGVRMTPPKMRNARSTVVPLPSVPRKVSTAESIAAGANVNLSRGKVNRRRPPSTSLRRQSDASDASSNSEEETLSTGNGILGSTWVSATQ